MGCLRLSGGYHVPTPYVFFGSLGALALTAALACSDGGGGGSSAASTVSSVTVAPTTSTVVYGETKPFTATVVGTGTPSQSVTWKAEYGTITTGGLYTAPGSGTTDTVTATSTLDPAKSGTATVALVAPWVGVKQLGISGMSTAGQSVAADANGNAYVAGSTRGGLDGNALTGTLDSYIAKYSASGVLR